MIADNNSGMTLLAMDLFIVGIAGCPHLLIGGGFSGPMRGTVLCLRRQKDVAERLITFADGLHAGRRNWWCHGRFAPI
jgi:hypothetical protein